MVPANEISKVISELADNACEHTKTDCLVDVYVSEPTYKKEDGGDEEFYAIGRADINFLGTAYNFTLIAKKEEVKEYENNGNEKNRAYI